MLGINDKIMENILSPLTRRIGTALATWLIAHGVQEQSAEQIPMMAAALLSIGFDLKRSYMARERIK